MTAYIYPDSGGETFVNRTGPQTITGPKTFLAGSATSIPLVIQAASGQTGNLTEWKDSGGNIVSRIAPAGSFESFRQMRLYNDNPGATSLIVSTPAGNTANIQEWIGSAGTVAQVGPSGQGVFGGSSMLGRLTSLPTAGGVGLVVRGAASQTANLQEWQDSTGAVLGAVSSNGLQSWGPSGTGSTFISPGSGRLQVNMTAAGAINPALTVKGAAGQTGNLTEWQNSSGTVLGSFSAGGALTITQDAGVIIGAGTQGSDGSAGLMIKYSNTAISPIVIRSPSGQTANYITLQNSIGQQHFRVASTGETVLLNPTAATNANYASVTSPQLSFQSNTWDSAQGNVAQYGGIFLGHSRTNVTDPTSSVNVRASRDAAYVTVASFLGEGGMRLYKSSIAPSTDGGSGCFWVDGAGNLYFRTSNGNDRLLAGV